MTLYIIRNVVGDMVWYRVGDTWSANRDAADLYSENELPALGPDAEPWDKEQVG